MAQPPASDGPDNLDEIRALLPKRQSPIRPLLVILSFIGVVVAAIEFYQHMPERGASLGGDGYIVVLPDKTTWVMINAGAVVLASPESAAKVHAQTGPCSHIEGGMKDPTGAEFEIDQLECTPGAPLLPTVVARMHYMGAKFGYWADGLKPAGDDLERHLRETPEVIAAVIDPRADYPQLIPLYQPLVPSSLSEARKSGLPPPVLISIRRNDLLILRYRAAALAEFLHRDRFIFAGAAAMGGWLVRELVVTPDGTPSLERLLVAPEEVPWPDRLREPTVRVTRREQAPDRSSGAAEKAHGDR